MICRDGEKYGNNVESVDALAVAIIDHAAAYHNRPNCCNGRFQMAVNLIDYHIRYGELIGAMPDGWLAGMPLSPKKQRRIYWQRSQWYHCADTFCHEVRRSESAGRRGA